MAPRFSRPLFLGIVWGMALGGPAWHWLVGPALQAWANPVVSQEPTAPVWLHGSNPEMFASIERHLRGLDVAMVEIGHPKIAK